MSTTVLVKQHVIIIHVLLIIAIRTDQNDFQKYYKNHNS